MDPREKAAYLIDKGYITSDQENAFYQLSDQIEESQQISADTTHVSSPSTIIDYNYTLFIKGINKIAQQIRDDSWQPDYIVGIVRGGVVPAVYLSHKLKIPVQMVHWNTRDDTNWNNESNTWIPEDIVSGKNVLIVEDIIDSGKTISELLTDWNKSVNGQLNLDFIRVSAMVYNTTQNIKVDYYDIAIDREVERRWIHFDWEGEQ